MFRFAHSAALAAVASLAMISAPARAGVDISISCSSLGVELELCRSGADEWAKKTGNQVKLVPTPSDAQERLSLYLTLLASKSADIDIFQIDIVWAGTLAQHFIDLGEGLPAEDRKDHLEALIANDTVDGKLVALPFFVDAGLLYYRKDLLEKYARNPPETWTELADTAAMVMQAERPTQPDMQGYVWQGRAYEGLLCNALEWIASEGGALIGKDGAFDADSPQAVAALTMAKGWIGKISPQGVLNYSEEDARSAFQSGKAVFMRNWPYAWALANAADSPVKDKVGIALLPKGAGAGARHAATLGGQHLAVSRYSAHPKEAADLARYLTGRDEQKRRALKGSFNPTRRSLYQDQDLLAANPFLKDFLAVLDNAVARPSTLAGTRYARVASAIIQSFHDALSGSGDVAGQLKNLDSALDRIGAGRRR